MLDGFNGFWEVLTSRGIPSTVLLLVLLFLLRWVALRYVRRERQLSKELRLRWQNVIKNVFVLAGFIGLVMIWAPQLRAFALSLTAVVVAIVIATKELILCVSGSLLRASSSTFVIGDLVEYAGHIGYVVDQSLLTTEIQEVDEVSGLPSGNQVVLPNSLFLSHPVKNFSHLRPYRVHSFSLHIDPDQAGAVDALLACTEERAAAISRNAASEREFEQLPKWKRQLLKTSAPKVHLGSTNIGKIAFVISIVCQEAKAMQYQTDIARVFYRTLAQESAEISSD